MWNIWNPVSRSKFCEPSGIAKNVTRILTRRVRRTIAHFAILFLYSLKVQKEKLDILQSTQVTSLDALENQLEESKAILVKMKQNVQGEILGNLFDVLLTSDVDGNGVMSDGEINDLITKMEKMNDVNFNDELVTETIINHGRSIDAIMELTKNLLSEDVEERNKYFHVVQ